MRSRSYTRRSCRKFEEAVVVICATVGGLLVIASVALGVVRGLVESRAASAAPELEAVSISEHK